MPVLLICLLINFTAVGLLFNVKFNINLASFSNLTTRWWSEASADTASSTVTVKNAAPAFTVNPAESPVSSSTSPVNVGGTLSFTATADDPENNSYYLTVCSTNSATPGAGGGQPTCGGVQFCVSPLTGDTAQATCSYSNVADPGAESRAWYAFVCDNHGSEPACSSANQGSGDSGTPFYINHAPAFTVLTTTSDNKDPGGAFTVTASSTDADVQGGADTLTLSVCSTNSWATSTGCAATTLCTGTSTGPNISCQFNTAIPTAHGAQSYYGFVKDWHEMPSAANSRTSTYTTNNVAPTVANITLNNGAAINPNIKNAPNRVVWATSTSVTDNNGCGDVLGATSTFYMSNAAGGANCAANDNNCYRVAAGNCYISDCTGGSDTIATVACTASLAFHSVPTTASGTNPYAAYNWITAINAYDDTTTGSATSSGVELNVTSALEVTELTIPYGLLQAGQNTGASNATTTVVNFGNSPLDSDLVGTWMTKAPDVIPENNQHFNLTNFTFPAGTAISSTTPQTAAINIARPTSATDLTSPVYWGMSIPAMTPSGDYAGVNTFTAVFFGTGNWN